MYVILGRGGILNSLIGLFILLPLVVAYKILIWALVAVTAVILLVFFSARGLYRMVADRKYRKMQANSQRILDQLGPPKVVKSRVE